VVTQRVPGAARLAVQGKMTVLDKQPEMRLERVAADAGEPGHLADRHPSVLARLIDDPDGMPNSAPNNTQ
jgi:hypothetical protein